MFHFYTPWKHQKTGGFLMFPGGIAVEHWLKMGQELLMKPVIRVRIGVAININGEKGRVNVTRRRRKGRKFYET